MRLGLCLGCNSHHPLETLKRGRCPACLRVQQRAKDKRRGTTTQRGYGAEWRRLREQVIAASPACSVCGFTGSRTIRWRLTTSFLAVRAEPMRYPISECCVYVTTSSGVVAVRYIGPRSFVVMHSITTTHQALRDEYRHASLALSFAVCGSGTRRRGRGSPRRESAE
jgi:hypothetical protein